MSTYDPTDPSSDLNLTEDEFDQLVTEGEEVDVRVKWREGHQRERSDGGVQVTAVRLLVSGSEFPQPLEVTRVQILA